MPILSGPPDDPRIVLDQHLMRGTTARAQELLDKVIALYPGDRSEHVLRPSEVLLIDNLRTVHGRSSFAPRYDGRDRFVLRSSWLVISQAPPTPGRAADERSGGRDS